MSVQVHILAAMLGTKTLAGVAQECEVFVAGGVWLVFGIVRDLH